MLFSPKNFDSWSEADVREEFLAPLLANLGYEKGTANDIFRELSLSYPRTAFGTRKPTDPPLRGAPDYICEVGFPSGRKVKWVLEAKNPSEPLMQRQSSRLSRMRTTKKSVPSILVFQTASSFASSKPAQVRRLHPSLRQPIRSWARK